MYLLMIASLTDSAYGRTWRRVLGPLSQNTHRPLVEFGVILVRQVYELRNDLRCHIKHRCPAAYRFDQLRTK
jgi:hypothetical protein